MSEFIACEFRDLESVWDFHANVVRHERVSEYQSR